MSTNACCLIHFYFNFNTTFILYNKAQTDPAKCALPFSRRNVIKFKWLWKKKWMYVLWICSNVISAYTIPINPSNRLDWFMVAQNHKRKPRRKKQNKNKYQQKEALQCCVCVYNISSLERQSYELPLLIISPSLQGISNFRLQHYVLWGWLSEMESVPHIIKNENRKQSFDRRKWFS